MSQSNHVYSPDYHPSSALGFAKAAPREGDNQGRKSCSWFSRVELKIVALAVYLIRTPPPSLLHISALVLANWRPLGREAKRRTQSRRAGLADRSVGAWWPSAVALMRKTRSVRGLCLAVLLGSAPCWSIEALPCVGRVSSATRTLSVIGTVHTPSRQQLREVARLIRSTRPDVVLVELDQPRLEQLLKQQHRAGPLGGPPTFGAELAEAVAVAAACDTPVVLGDAVLPLDALWRDRPFLDAPRLWRAARLRLRRRFPGVEVHPNPNSNPNLNPNPNPNSNPNRASKCTLRLTLTPTLTLTSRCAVCPWRARSPMTLRRPSLCCSPSG